MNIDRIEIYKSRRVLKRRREWRWRFVAGNGKRLANGGEGYANLGELLDALARVIGVARGDLLELQVSRNAYSINRAGRTIHMVVLGR